MLIDWFTVGAQFLNFLILVWLMKHFLYKPILNAIDVREKRIAKQVADADAKKADAEKQLEDFQKKNKALDDERAALLSKATDDAKAQREQLLAEAQKEADGLRAAQATSLKEEQVKLGHEVSQLMKTEVFEITRKTLADLTTVSLEERLSEVFTRRLREISGNDKTALGVALKTSSEPAVITSTCDLPADQKAAIQNALNETFSAAVRLRFQVSPNDVSGIELTSGGQKVVWSIDQYLSTLDQKLGALLAAQAPAPKKPEQPDKSAPDAKGESGAGIRRNFGGQMTAPPEVLESAIQRTFTGLREARAALTPKLTLREVGVVTHVSTGIAVLSGLPGVGFDELVQFHDGLLGIAFNVDEDSIGVILLGDFQGLHAGAEVERTGRVMDIGVGAGLLGRVINALGKPLDGKGPVVEEKRLPIERPAPAIMDRAAVEVPLQTGLKVVDAMIPIGRGQRELILGDRQTGKTAIAIDTILNQRGKDVICVYCAIGQRASAVAKVVANLREKGALEYTVVVVAEGNDAPGLVYITPYAATTIAEYFMEAGHNVLIIYDDLTNHARAYREISLLLRRPPGREAFPGDIFYIHSRMLERSTHLIKERGGGSLTALPIIETEAQDISAYIPTNLISITDGQIYLSPALFELGVLPAVDVAKSVSRVGGAAQLPAYRAVAGTLKLAYSQFEELESFAKFGTRLDDSTRKTIEHGKRIRACLKQPESEPVSMVEQITVLMALSEGFFDPIPLDKANAAEDALRKAAAAFPKDLTGRLESAAKLSDADKKAIIDIAKQAVAPFVPKPAPKPAK